MPPLGQGAWGEPGQSTRCKGQPRGSPSPWQAAGAAGSAGRCVQLAASPVAPSPLMWAGSTQCHPGTGQDLRWDPPAVRGHPASVLSSAPRDGQDWKRFPFPMVLLSAVPPKGESHRLSP